MNKWNKQDVILKHTFKNDIKPIRLHNYNLLLKVHDFLNITKLLFHIHVLSPYL